MNPSSTVNAPYLSGRYFEDVIDQPRALSALLDSASHLAEIPNEVSLRKRPRVIISGMGTSHYAGFGLWMSLVRLGVPAWWVETTQLLDTFDGLLVPDSLLWLTSQSGESAETVALLNARPLDQIHVVGVTNNPESVLGRSAHTRIDLLAGDEATVSTKSYVNSLAVGRLLSAQLAGNVNEVEGLLRATVGSLQSYLSGIDESVDSLNDFALGKHILFAGRGVATASALAAGLVMKEAAKVPTEGMTAGGLRHGVLELAGPGLAVTFFDHRAEAHRDQNVLLARDLSAAGTEIAWVSSRSVDGDRLLPAPTGDNIDPAIRDAVAFQTLSFQMAKRSGIAAGAFNFASKVTSIL